MHIIGTAGHVDHGKSALTNALTGTNPDRWLEEQLRGMTIDLGFAHLRFEDGTEAGIIDVPGHERFLHNMLAGAAGMELLLLVIAANEGIMPQTVEHLQILQYLNVREAIVVISKSDLLEDQELAVSCERIRAGLAGTLAGAAALLCVSTVTGDGLAALREAIHRSLLRLPPRDPQAPAYLPIDRVFALPGHGTIVTGTLMQGRIAAGDTLALQPSGKTVRVRAVQSFGRNLPSVEGGSRAAVNLPSVAVGEIARGEMLVSAEFIASAAFNVVFSPLAAALPLLRRRNSVRAYIGSAEILGTLVFEAAPGAVGSYSAQLLLDRPTVAFPGSAFVARRLSPKNVLGGGRIEGAHGVAVTAEAQRPYEESVRAVLRSFGLRALTPAEIAREVNVRVDAVQGVLDALTEREEVLLVARPAGYVDGEAARKLLSRTLELLGERQRAEPWSMGATSVAISRALAVEEPLLVRLLHAFAQEGRVAHRGGYYSTSEHVPRLTAEQQAFFEQAVPHARDGALTPVALSDVVAKVTQSRVPGIAKAFDTLLAKGVLVKVGDQLYRGSQIAAAHARVETFLRANRQMTMAQFRDIIGTSRKYAVPLLEWFDGRGVTVRSGDYRMLRGSRP